MNSLLRKGIDALGKTAESSKTRKAVLDFASQIVEIQERNSGEKSRIKREMNRGAREGSRKFRV